VRKNVAAVRAAHVARLEGELDRERAVPHAEVAASEVLHELAELVVAHGRVA